MANAIWTFATTDARTRPDTKASTQTPAAAGTSTSDGQSHQWRSHLHSGKVMTMAARTVKYLSRLRPSVRGRPKVST